MHKIFPNKSKGEAGKNESSIKGLGSGDGEKIQEKVTLKLSPLSRLYFTLDQEFFLDKSVVSDAERYNKFIKMYQLAEQKRDSLLRSLIIFDALILLLLFGKSITIPGTNISLSEFPAAREASTFLASLGFQFFAFSFVNWHGYAAIVDTINTHRARNTGIDPDYISAADKFLEFVVKLYRGQMNVHGVDFITPSNAYKFVAMCVTGLLALSVLSFLVLHLAVIGISIRETLFQDVGFLKYVYAVAVSTSTLGGLLVFLTLNRSFEFTVR
jgi:hypothetical protein